MKSRLTVKDADGNYVLADGHTLEEIFAFIGGYEDNHFPDPDFSRGKKAFIIKDDHIEEVELGGPIHMPDETIKYSVLETTKLYTVDSLYKSRKAAQAVLDEILEKARILREIVESYKNLAFAPKGTYESQLEEELYKSEAEGYREAVGRLQANRAYLPIREKSLRGRIRRLEEKDNSLEEDVWAFMNLVNEYNEAAKRRNAFMTAWFSGTEEPYQLHEVSASVKRYYTSHKKYYQQNDLKVI